MSPTPKPTNKRDSHKVKDLESERRMPAQVKNMVKWLKGSTQKKSQKGKVPRGEIIHLIILNENDKDINNKSVLFSMT